jgi:DNA polymerase elongation subunit (family B)
MRDQENDIIFQVLNWVAIDVEPEDDDGDDDDGDDSNNGSDDAHYHIKMFGVNEAGKSVSVTVSSFEPHFYVKLMSNISVSQKDSFAEVLSQRIANGAYVRASVVKKKDFWGFTNEKEFLFLRLTFKSESAMKTAARVLSAPKPFIVPGLPQKVFKCYESNISPLLRFAHIRDIPSVGWVRISNYTKASVLPSKCSVDIQAHWKDVQPYQERDNQIAPFLIAAFDIECMSCDGDFPVARKDYKKIANDVYNLLHRDAPTKQVVELIINAFKEGRVIPFVPIDSQAFLTITNKLLQHMDHVKIIVAGDNMVMRAAIRDIMLSTFSKGGLETYDRLIGFYNKIQPTTTSTSLLRRSLQTWLHKCFNQQRLNIVWAKRSDTDNIIEGILSHLMKDKDAIVDVLAGYLSSFMPAIRGDEIIQIGTTFHRYGESEVHSRIIYTLGTCADVPGATVVECESERDMLQKWVAMIGDTDPDVISGYNIFGFDFAFMYDRSIELGCKDVFDDLSRLSEYAATFRESRLSSSALGDNLMRYIDMPGRTLIDMMKVVQRDHKLDSYKLDTVASHFMGMNKLDVSPQEIFDLYRTGIAENIAKIADYCVQDCALCNKLIMKLETMASNIGMANVCSVPLSYIFMRGQGVKIFSLIAKECKKRGYLVPVVNKAASNNNADNPDNEESYEGAIVLEPKTGIYIDTPIAVLDYASLYPSSMISENLSHDCIVLDAKYDNLPGVDYLDVEYDLYDTNESGEKKVVGTKVCRYAQPKGEESRGILPNILIFLLKQRKLTRKRIDMKIIIKKGDGESITGHVDIDKVNNKINITAMDGKKYVVASEDIDTITDLYTQFQKATLDGLQLAYKITANSLYGQMGAKTSPVYLKEIAACTTATGRKMILLAKQFLEDRFKADVVYGDSVTGETPVLIKYRNGTIDVVAIKDLAVNWTPYNRFLKDGTCKEQAFVPVEVWCNGKWTNVRRVIRHKSKKKIYRVGTAFGSVDVTEDHSLIEKGTHQMLTPNQLELFKTEIGGDLPNPSMFESKLCYDHMESFGERMREFPEDMRGTDAVFSRLRAILNSSISTRKRFIAGLMNNDVQITLGSNERIAQYVCVILNSIYTDYKVKVYRNANDAAFVLTLAGICHEANQENHVESVVSLSEKVMSGGSEDDELIVYDLETEEGIFQGGVGEILLKNTDSLFVHFPDATSKAAPDDTLQGQDGRTALVKTIEIGKEASEAIKPILKHPHDLEYEKTFWPFILFSKKRYVANQYGTDPNKFKQTSMGIVLKRRDNANIVKKVYGGVIDIILNQHDVKASVSFLKDSLDQLIQGKYPLDDLVISKTLRAHYKDPTRIAHRVLADRIKERSPGNAPQANDRIPYVYIANLDGKKVLQGNRIEHPDYIKEKGLNPDYEFYISHQIMNPVLQLYAIVLEQLEGFQEKTISEQWHNISKQMRQDGKSEQQIKEKLSALREIEVRKLLFDPVFKKIKDDPITKMLKNKQNGNRTITEWFKPA